MCREEGQSLSQLTAAASEGNDSSSALKNSNRLDGFGLFGIVKETAVDDEGLLAFYNDYYKFPLYKDDTLQFYNALGNRKIGLETWNPFKLWRSFRELSKRLASKNIQGNFKGEGLTQGGVILFDKHGQLRATYLERTGHELPIDDILAAAQALREEEEEPVKTEL